MTPLETSFTSHSVFDVHNQTIYEIKHETETVYETIFKNHTVYETIVEQETVIQTVWGNTTTPGSG